MAILYRPIISYDRHRMFNWIFSGLKYRSPKYKIEKYVDNDVLDRANIFKEKLTMDIVGGASFFFILLNAAYNLTLRGFSTKEILEVIMEEMVMV
jgi:hypothetical protein